MTMSTANLVKDHHLVTVVSSVDSPICLFKAINGYLKNYTGTLKEL